MAAIITGEWIDLPCIVNRFIPSFYSLLLFWCQPQLHSPASASPTPFGSGRFKSILGVKKVWKR